MNSPNAACQASDATAAGPRRFCCCSNRNGTSTGCSSAKCTDKWPADAFSRTSGVGLESAMGNASGLLVDVFSRTGLPGRNCKRGASTAEAVLRTNARRGRSDLLDASCPGADRGVAAAIGVQQRQRVGGARLAANGDEDAAAAGERLEDAA